MSKQTRDSDPAAGLLRIIETPLSQPTLLMICPADLAEIGPHDPRDHKSLRDCHHRPCLPQE